MKKHRAIIFVVILLIITGIIAMIHFNTREDVPEGAIEVSFGEETYVVDISKLSYETVTGVRVNGKGEEKTIEASGILLGDVLLDVGITEFGEVSVIADDAYSAELTWEEVMDSSKAYLIQEEGEERLRMIVFGDKDSKRSVSNVAQIAVSNLSND